MTEVVRDPVAGLGGGRDVVTCPECGTRTSLDLLRRDASAFCARCDFPLFWADRGSATGAGASYDDAPHRRAPGVEGEAAGVTVPCPVCGEPHASARGTCVRCGADLSPPPPPVVPLPPAPEPEPQVVVVREQVPCTHPRTWVVALVSALLASGLTYVVVAVALR